MTSATALAIDIGGTKAESAIVDGSGTIVPGSRHRFATSSNCSPPVFASGLTDIIGRSLATVQDRPSCVGIGSAGPIDRTAGTISPLNMPGLRRFPVMDVVAAASGDVPSALALDGTCIALAETSSRGNTDGDLLCMVVSTGIGAGIISQGHPLLGDSGNAGHIGQLRSRELKAGQPATAGTLEDIASGPGSVRWARSQGWTGETGEELSRDAAAGDPTARAAIERSASAVGEAIAGLCAVLDVRTVVVGGGFANGAPDYRALVERATRTAAVLPAAHEVSILGPSSGNDAPLLGAAVLARMNAGSAERPAS